MRVAVLWQGMSGYLAACLTALSQAGAELLIVHEATSVEAPFQDSDFGDLGPRHVWSGAPDTSRLNADLDAFGPDVMLISSWHIPAYREQAKARSGKALRVLCMDNQWQEQPRQWVGRASRSVYLQPYFDLVFCPGERSASFSRHLGFRRTKTMRGLYCADTDAFSQANARTGRPAFLFAGRLVEDKGLDVLLPAYRQYRRQAQDPWDLLIAGTGPLPVAREEGVTALGFVGPDDLPGVMSRASAFVLPSRFEPWGVVVHEAAAAGLPIVCSDAVGAAEFFVRDGLNGLIVPSESPEQLARALSRLASRSPQDLARMGETSRALAATWTPELWASYVLDELSSALRAKADPVAPPTSVVLQQTAVPSYRAEFVSALSQQLPGLRVLCGRDYANPEVTTDWTLPRLEKVTNHFFADRRLWWQSGVLRRTWRADVAVLEFNPRILSNWVVLLLRRLLGRPTLLWGHARGRDGRRRASRRAMQSCATSLIVYTETEATSLPGADVTAAPNALYALDRASYEPTGTPQHVLCVGRLSRDKQPVRLLRAFHEALPDLPTTTKLILVGAGPEEAELRRLADELGLAARVELRGSHFDYQELADVYASALICVIPGYAGLSVIQSLWFGVPLIVSRHEDHAPEIEACTTSNTVYFEHGERGLTEALVAVFHDGPTWCDRRTEIALSARATYNVDVMAAAWAGAVMTVTPEGARITPTSA